MDVKVLDTGQELNVTNGHLQATPPFDDAQGRQEIGGGCQTARARPPVACRPQGPDRSGRQSAGRAFLEAHATKEVSLEPLARVTGLSPFQLIRVFRQEAGLPPHAPEVQARNAAASSWTWTVVPSGSSRMAKRTSASSST